MDRKQTDIIDLAAVWREYRSKWYWFAISVFVCCSIAFVFKRMKLPVYAVASNVLIESDDANPLAGMDLGGLFGGKNNVDDEIFLISAHSVYKEVARDMGLDRIREFKAGLLAPKVVMQKDYPLDVIVPPSFADTTSIGITFKIKIDDKGLADVVAKGPRKVTLIDVDGAKLPLEMKTIYGTFVLTATPSFEKGEPFKATISVGGYDGAAEDIAAEVSSTIASKRSNVIQMRMKTPYPDFGKELLNAIMAKYNERVISDKNVQARKTLEFLDDRIALVSGELAKSEGSVQKFKESRGIIDVETEAKYNLGMKTELSPKLLEAETQLEVLKMARDFIATPGNEYSLVPFNSDASNSSVNLLIQTYNELVLERIKLQSAARKDNVALKRLDEQIDAMRVNIVTTLAKNYESAEVTVREMRNKLSHTDSRLGSIPEKEREFITLQRDHELQQEIYVYMLQRREETAIMLANAVSKGVIIDEAFMLRDPVSMSTKMMLAIAFILGLFMPVGIFYLRKLFRSKPESREEIEGQVDAPVLGEMCTSQLGRPLVVTSSSTSSTAELFRLIRSNLQFMLTGVDDKVVLFTSSKSGEGKSFISINTAASLALLDRKVLLVGMDVRLPRLAEYLELPQHIGLTQYLVDSKLTIDDVIIREPVCKNMDVVAAGIVPPNPSELLLSKRVADFFNEVRKRYDYIIVDTAPVGMVSDTFSLARYADATVYVTRLGATEFSDLRFINSVYEEKRLPRMSLVVNGTHKSQGYGYGYGRTTDDEASGSSSRKKK